jgi:protein-S-isoprenylcysteine O-methyltransferase Ste14
MDRLPPHVVFLPIAGLILFLYLVAVAITIALRLPWDLSLPIPVRALGLLVLAGGAGLAAWAIRFRGFHAVVESTWLTLRKLVRRAPLDSPRGRTEPLVVAGPYRHVRHPLYSGVVLLTFGIALAVDRTAALLGAFLLFLWFALVLAPFEERELRLLFGEAYAEYMRRTPRLIPGPWRRS